MQNSAAKKYIPVFARMEERWVHNPRMNSASKEEMVPKHERGNTDFWGAQESRKPRIAFTIMRLCRRRIGQLELFKVLKGGGRKASKKMLEKSMEVGRYAV